jgi:putative transposase
MDSLLAGTLILPWKGHCAGYDVQRRRAVETFRGSRKPFRDQAKTVRLPAGITVRLQPGILFVFTRNRFRAHPGIPFALPRNPQMSKSAHTEAQIIGVVKQVEAGRKADEVAREMGVSKHTIYAWKAKYGGMEVSEAQEVKQLREENGRLKKLVADLSLDKDMLQSVMRKNSLGS